MKATISYRPEESGFAELLKSYLCYRFPGGRLKRSKEPNAHGNHVAYFIYNKDRALFLVVRGVRV